MQTLSALDVRICLQYPLLVKQNRIIVKKFILFKIHWLTHKTLS